jgi:hypothetical protein
MCATFDIKDSVWQAGWFGLNTMRVAIRFFTPINPTFDRGESVIGEKITFNLTTPNGIQSLRRQ